MTDTPLVICAIKPLKLCNVVILIMTVGGLPTSGRKNFQVMIFLVFFFFFFFKAYHVASGISVPQPY